MQEAARRSGVELASTCGGDGTCGCCRVRVVRGEVTAVNVAVGLRLARQTDALGDALIDVPPESLTAAQRLQLEGGDSELELDPPVITRHLALVPPTLDDHRSDATRLRSADLNELLVFPIHFGQCGSTGLSESRSSNGHSTRCFGSSLWRGISNG